MIETFCILIFLGRFFITTSMIIPETHESGLHHAREERELGIEVSQAVSG